MENKHFIYRADYIGEDFMQTRRRSSFEFMAETEQKAYNIAFERCGDRLLEVWKKVTTGEPQNDNQN